MATSNFLLINIFLSLVCFFFHGDSITHWRDIQVLSAFKNAVDPTSLTPGSCLSSWDFSVDPCDNLSGQNFTCGLRCDSVISGASRVTDLSLDGAGYSGILASITWDLPFLRTLDLSGNSFSGPLPDSFSNLTRLQRLGLSANSLSGPLPDSLGSLSELQELYLDNNNLQGPIPLSLNGLRNLKRLELQQNRLSGEFPDLSQLGSLGFLYASDNSISGALPANFPSSLVELSMRNNQLEGNIPASVADSLPLLQVLDLSHNKLSGSVPGGLFTHPSLEQLTLSDNRFRWVSTPANWGRNSELIAVDLSNNELRGGLPGFLGWMPKLSALAVENNKFSGMIPTQYAVKAVMGSGGSVAPFERLLLGGNYLFGLIPGPFLQLKPGTATVSLAGNCLYECPVSFFFCQGRQQKTLMECKTFSPVIP